MSNNQLNTLKLLRQLGRNGVHNTSCASSLHRKPDTNMSRKKKEKIEEDFLYKSLAHA